MSGSYIDRFKEVEAERDGLTERINLLRADLDAVTVERDEAYKQRDEARSQSKTIGDAWAKFEREHDAALAEARRERDEARKNLEGWKDECSDRHSRLNESRKQLDDLRNAIDDARAILGARPDELLSDAAQRAKETSAPAIREALGLPDGGSVVNRLADLLHTERMAVDDLKTATTRLRRLSGIVGLPESATWDDVCRRASALASDVAILGKQKTAMIDALGWSADKPMGDLLDYARGVMAEIANARQILGAAEGESLGDAARGIRNTLNPPAGCSVLRAAEWYRYEVETLRAAYMPEAAKVRKMLGLAVGESIQDSVRLLLERAEAEPPQVFRIIPRVTIGRDGVRFEVVTRDPSIRALTADQLARLGLVVCDE